MAILLWSGITPQGLSTVIKPDPLLELILRNWPAPLPLTMAIQSSLMVGSGATVTGTELLKLMVVLLAALTELLNKVPLASQRNISPLLGSGILLPDWRVPKPVPIFSPK